MAAATRGISVSAAAGPAPLSGAALSKEITAALQAAGFAWVQGVALKKRGWDPNWTVARLIGVPPGTKAYVEAMEHPLIRELQKKFTLA